MQNEALTDANPFEDLSYAEAIAEINKSREALTSNAERVYDFHYVMNMPINKWPPTQEEINFRETLIFEELEEVKTELHDLDFVQIKKNMDKKKVAKELADLLYVVYGTAISFGIDIDRVFEEVHRSNMSKLDADGNPIRRADGKVLKGPNYTEPNLDFVDE